jgi:hypothetical protein
VLFPREWCVYEQGRSKGGGQVGPAHPRILLADPRIKVKYIKNKIHLQYLSIICLWFKIWPTPAKNHCYALVYETPGIYNEVLCYITTVTDCKHKCLQLFVCFCFGHLVYQGHSIIYQLQILI